MAPREAPADAEGRVTGIKRPGATSDSTQVVYGANGVSQVTNEGVTTNYARTVTATGQTKPPTPGTAQGQISPASQDQMLKAQRAARDRDKAWDAKMNKTMGSICKGC